MRVYVAAKYEDKHYVKAVLELLRKNGHEITYDWTEGDDTGLYAEAQLFHLSKCAQDELEGVKTCDAFILFPHIRGKGMYFEMGAAVAFGKRVIIVGRMIDDPKMCIFYRLPQVEWQPNILTVLSVLK